MCIEITIVNYKVARKSWLPDLIKQLLEQRILIKLLVLYNWFFKSNHNNIEFKVTTVIN